MTSEKSASFRVAVQSSPSDKSAFVWAIYCDGEKEPIEKSDRTYSTAEKAREIAELELTRIETEGG